MNRKSPAFSMPGARVLQVVSLLLVALIFGGGGSAEGLANLVVQLVALGLIACNRQAVFDFFAQAPRIVAVLVAACILLPFLQSIPLPPSVWQHLPGRGLATEALALVGGSDDWLPFSLNVRRTMVAGLALMPPLAVMILSWNLPEPAKRQLLFALVAAGGFVVLLGAQQLALGNRVLVPYAEAIGTTDLQGTFANHNSTGLFIDIVLCALVGILPRRRSPLVWHLAWVATAILLLIGLFLTRSRSGMALVVVPAILFLIQFWQSRSLHKASWRRLVLGGSAFVVVVGGIAGLGLENRRIQQSLARFDELQDARPLIWEDTLAAIRHFWPLGSGIGTFDEVFQLDESLENIGPGRAGRAHNDYLEAALESGAVGVGLLAAWALVLAAGCFHALRRGGTALVPAGVLVLLALQSILDYPLRNQTLLCLAGLMLALLVGVWSSRGSERGQRDDSLGN